MLSNKAKLVADNLRGFWKMSPTRICELTPGAEPSIDTSCSFSFNGNNGVYCPNDSTIYIDAPMLNNFDQLHGSAFPSVAFVAHEWGHRVQHALGIIGPGGQSSPSVELQADCLAGMFAAVQFALGHISQADQDATEYFFCTIGGNDASPWFSDTSHGTCTQRANRYMAGFNGAWNNLAAVCESATVLASTICPL